MKARLLPPFAAVALVVAGCSNDANDDLDPSGAGGAGGAAEDGGGPNGDDPSPTAFSACGGKIYDPKTHDFDPAEYVAQARRWDRDALDCRLGPRFDFYHPDDADTDRPTAPEAPRTPHEGGFLCPEFNKDWAGPATYGSTSGQVAFAPDDPGEVGLQRLQTTGWEGSGQCWQPLQGDHLGGVDPDGAVAQWQSQGIEVGVPIAKGRTEHAETGDGVVIFSNGLVGTTGTQTSGSSHPTFQLPPNKVPTAVSLTNYNEFALVTIWDTEALRAQVAVFVLRAKEPASFSIHLFGAPNEGGFDGLQLLGYVDLPDDFRTPTSISATGNNTQRNGHPWIDYEDPHAYQGVGTIFSDLSYGGLVANTAEWIWETDPMEGEGLFGSAGGALIASRWEDQVLFLDLAPLYAFVRKVYVEPIQNQDNQSLFEQASTGDVWPFDFESNPEMVPTVAGRAPITHPTAVRLGLSPEAFPEGLRTKLLAWVATLDGTVALFDASSLTGKAPDAAFEQVASVQADPNITSLHLTNRNDAAFVSSRGNRSIQWLSVTPDALVIDRAFRDSRIDDPVATDRNQRVGNLITIGDFDGGAVFNFDSNCDATPCTYVFDGELSLPGAVYFVDTANVN